MRQKADVETLDDHASRTIGPKFESEHLLLLAVEPRQLHETMVSSQQRLASTAIGDNGMDTQQPSTIERLLDEGPIPLNEAKKVFGAIRRGRPVHASTLARWALRGMLAPTGERIRLESFRLGNAILTSKPALIRFLQHLQSASLDHTPTATRPPSTRTRAADRAGQQLAEMGV